MIPREDLHRSSPITARDWFRYNFRSDLYEFLLWEVACNGAVPLNCGLRIKVLKNLGLNCRIPLPDIAESSSVIYIYLSRYIYIYAIKINKMK